MMELIELLPDPCQDDGGRLGQQQEQQSLLAKNNNEEEAIERHCAKNLSYNEFFWKYLKRNWPVILTETSTDWECRCNWTISGHNDNDNGNVHNDINFDYLREKIGNRDVPVADCGATYYNSHAKIQMNFDEFLEHWKTVRRVVGEDVLEKNEHCNALSTVKNLYLKDWHLKAQMPDYEFYYVPKHFASDWLNEYLLETKSDDYRFVYMGPKDTWTPFHADVFGSYSWSTNIVGCKKWLLLKPGDELKLADHLGNLPFAINENLLDENSVKYFTILQRENESIFVPSGWFHQVTNLTDTISINHNWLNACNIEKIWRNLATNMQQVIAEIEDCRDMQNFNDHCQKMLRATFGMNYTDFLDLLEVIAKRRLNSKYTENNNNTDNNRNHQKSENILFDIYKLNTFHIEYDLICTQNVLKIMLDDHILNQNQNQNILYKKCHELLDTIQSTTNK